MRKPMYLAVILVGLTTTWLYSAGSQRTFDSPQDAIRATIDASERNDVAALRQIFGPGSKDIVESGDPAADKADRKEFVSLAQEKMVVNQDPSNPGRVTFSIGVQDWPFPVPLVRSDGKWRFDTASGRMEMLAHRIGENELTAIDACREFVQAELQYASSTHDGARLQQYARKLMSSPGKEDGLYWKGGSDGVLPRAFAEAVESGKPFHGYRFRILTAQGPSAPDGAFNYLVDGKLMGGFALVAWPAEYEISGVKTFIVDHDGIVYEKDLGRSTNQLAKEMSRFDPDASWHEVHDESDHR